MIISPLSSLKVIRGFNSEFFDKDFQSVTDLDDPDLARLVFRSDVNDTVTGIVNQYLDPVLGVYTPVEEVSSV